ncbi:IMS domain-containing protein [Leptolyngbya sp. BL0902]|uniref:IMS domain-containing protein n=1 Tax=Leptolyngbya sp. BL0902 TaxID=1115757 RepID=UPI0018E904EB|nr:IMS domain-containing protein [Leptolyngbya sp. BL0902]
MANDTRAQLPWVLIILIAIGSIAVFFLILTGRCSKVEVEAWRLALDCPTSEGSIQNNPSNPASELAEESPEEKFRSISNIDSGHEELMEGEAIALVQAWLAAKSSVYGPSYDRQLASVHINFPGIDAIYNHLDQLQRNDTHGPYYWLYDAPSNIDEVHRFEYFPSQGTAELVVTISEHRSFYTRRGKSPEHSGSSTTVSKYTFGRDSNGNWKIADIEEQRM